MARERITVTLWPYTSVQGALPGGAIMAPNQVYNNVQNVKTGNMGRWIGFFTRDGTKIESTLPYTIATETLPEE